jgi:lipid II:glycine glycyltransferase (peptidoglycan interpeptide bridge formation enzyme)
MDSFDLETSDPRLLDAGDSFLQTNFWGELKGEFGWRRHCFAFTGKGDDGRSCSGRILVLERRLFRGLSFAYLPHGPLFDPGVPTEAEGTPASSPDRRTEFLVLLSRALRTKLPRGCIFIRYDLPWYTVGEGGARPGLSRPLVQASMDVQPPDTVLLDISRGEDEILAGMKPKTRYNIKLSEKKGVEIRLSDERDLDSWYELYRETSKRDRIALHGKDYYLRLFTLAREYGKGAPEVRLYMASVDGRDIAGIVTLFTGKTAVYLYGASSNAERNRMPAYGLQWRAILDAKAAGCSSYDFFGIPPNDDPNHPMHGLYRFKTGFGGSIVHRAGCWDYPLRAIPYAAYRMAEASRRFYFKTLVKKLKNRGRSEE